MEPVVAVLEVVRVVATCEGGPGLGLSVSRITGLRAWARPAGERAGSARIRIVPLRPIVTGWRLPGPVAWAWPAGKNPIASAASAATNHRVTRRFMHPPRPSEPAANGAMICGSTQFGRESCARETSGWYRA